jgi:hypothetical protein
MATRMDSQSLGLIKIEKHREEDKESRKTTKIKSKLKRINKLEEKTIATTESWKIDDAES